MKTKAKIKNTSQILSRTTQKTFIIVVALAYLVQTGTLAYYSWRMLAENLPFGIGSFMVYPTTVVVLPLVVFATLYLMGSRKTTKLWRACQAAIITFLAIIAETFFSASNNMLFQQPLGYGSTPAASNAIVYQLIPMILTILFAVGVGIWIKLRTNTVNDASYHLQKAFVVLLPLIIICQTVVMLFGFHNGGTTDPATASSTVIIDAVASLIVPAVIFSVLYLLTSKQRTILQRSFITTIYMIIGMSLMITVTLTAFQITASLDSDMTVVLSSIVGIFGLAAFAGIVTWHKVKKLL